MIESINYEGWIGYNKITGERITEFEPATFGELTYTHPDGTERNVKFHRQNRPKLIAAFIGQAKAIGIDITYGQRVADYTEDEATQKGGVILDDGSKLEADIVIAADGVGTKSHKLVTGHEVRAYPSGFAIFRTVFPADLAISDPDIRDRWPLLDGWRSYIEMWLG